MSGDSALAENIGRAVLAAIRTLPPSAASSVAVAASATRPPQHSAPATPGPVTNSTSTGTNRSVCTYDIDGQPSISKEEIEGLLQLGTTLTEVASVLQISRPTLYKLMREFNIRHTKFCVISNEELDATVSNIKAEHPYIGEVMLNGHLRARNIVIQRHLLRNSIKRVDGAGVASRTISEFGRPIHIRTDHGGENVKIWDDMRVHRGDNSVFTGSSVHNQRIERFNRDLNRNCRDVFAPIFYELESMEALDVDNESDLFCLHFVYIPRINHILQGFKSAFSHHSVSSEGNRTPLQLFTLDKHLLTLHYPEAATEETVEFLSVSQAHYCFCPLNQQELQELVVAVDPLEDDGNKGKILYHRVQEFVYNKIVNV
ncbi:uncharacterized protein LOC115561219 [Xyrichtys novacula]|uniref:Uncharacterized protein LOC115561219 n=1 Tax=Xyrichtys novacula TaxID=13765 RepID=A0AAV1GN19_XYRNO|nr:uncharacterized protein LOC115561219 [Xyrichtys novacula]